MTLCRAAKSWGSAKMGKQRLPRTREINIHYIEVAIIPAVAHYIIIQQLATDISSFLLHPRFYIELK
jgi:hypothetical protein